MTSSPLSARTAPAPVLADLLPGARVRDVMLVGAYIGLIAASAQLKVFLPGNSVPITAQTLVVLLGAAALGTTRAGVGGTVYLALGVAGVPWFAASNGTTVGYIVGFVVAAWVVGRFSRAGSISSYRGAATAMVAGNLAIWVFGVSGLVLAARLGIPPVAGRSVVELVGIGVVPYLPGDALKIAIALSLLPATQRAVERNAG